MAVRLFVIICKAHRLLRLMTGPVRRLQGADLVAYVQQVTEALGDGKRAALPLPLQQRIRRHLMVQQSAASVAASTLRIQKQQ